MGTLETKFIFLRESHMTLSREAVQTLVDLIENKLAVLEIGDREDLREMVVLRRCLTELQGIEGGEAGTSGDIPRRGRRRKVEDMMGETEERVRA